MRVSQSLPILHASAYRFMRLRAPALARLQQACWEANKQGDVKGSVVLSKEGINLSVAGTAQAVRAYQAALETVSVLSGLTYRTSWSVTAPFTRFLVKIKPHLLPFCGRQGGIPVTTAHDNTHLAPALLYQWYTQGQSLQVLDVRNVYEYQLGHFHTAVHLGLDQFRDCGARVAALPASWDKGLPVITYCTAGIRCEQVVPWLLDQGFKQVYQLAGGIVAYFEQYGSQYYAGECFMFDKRIAIDGNRQETGTRQCFACRLPVIVSQQIAYAMHCPDCGASLLKS